MAESLRHRGPDDDGFWMSRRAGIALGHRRLSIVDLSASGRQPMVSDRRRFTMAFNGEIYNYEAIRAELRADGFRPEFRGHSDTEVALAAFEAWGVQRALDRFVGMFAIALWDDQERELNLIRDRLGIKPLYVGFTGKRLLFGSELKPLIIGGLAPDVDREALGHYVQTGYIPAPFSIFSSARKIPPGVIVRYAAPSAAPDSKQYWSAKEVAIRGQATPLFMSDSDALDSLEQLLSEAVRLRMIADVPLGAFLSGGIDSSVVVALMQRHSSRPVRTFSIGNETAYYDEAAAAEKVAKYLGCEHTTLVVSADLARGVIPKLADMFDEPFADSSQIPTYLVSELARKDVKVALSGDGGDEVFGGYNRHVWAPRVWRALRLAPNGLKTSATAIATMASPQEWDAVAAKAGLGRFIRRPGQQVHKLALSLGARSLEDLYARLSCFWPAGLAVGSSICAGRFALDDTLDPVHQLMLSDMLSYLPGDILTKVDRASMAVSLEARVPLLDHRVVEFAWRMPLGLKVRGMTGKWALRTLLKRHVPAELVERPKMGFSVPVGDWLRGPLKPWAEDLLHGQQNELARFLDLGPVLQRWREHLNGERDWGNHLWIVFAFEGWRRRNAQAQP